MSEAIPVESGSFPWATFVVNVVGCACIGAAARSVARDSDMWSVLVVGVLGGLTTFSAFASETRALFDSGDSAIAVSYVLATSIVGLTATELARGIRAAPT